MNLHRRDTGLSTSVRVKTASTLDVQPRPSTRLIIDRYLHVSEWLLQISIMSEWSLDALLAVEIEQNTVADEKSENW